MTPEQRNEQKINDITIKINDLAIKITDIEARCKSNTKRIDEHGDQMKENSSLIIAIKELAMETKYMRVDLNKTIDRLDDLEDNSSGKDELVKLIERVSKLETSGADKWEKLKWAILIAIITIIIAFIATQIGLK